jgi:4a-hydroxytetrahydrobiopterin dehydratase
MMKLAEMHCVPCRGTEPALTEQQSGDLLDQLKGWQIISAGGIFRLEKRYSFSSYAQAVAFTNAVAELAEKQDHHPSILLEWRQVTVQWWTHVVKGLHQNDFISAAKTDQLFQT